MIKYYFKLFILVFLFANCKPHIDYKTGKPNILVIVTDDLGWSDISAYGNEFIETPNIDQLANEGVKFTNAYSSAPLCSPSRASLWTGLHPVEVNITEHIHGPFRADSSIPLITPNIDQYLKLEYNTIGELLKNQGYKTAFIGKWHLGGSTFHPSNQGFDVTYASGYAGLPNSFHYPFFNHGMNELKNETSEGDYLTDALTDKTIDIINNYDTFLIVLSYYSPHVPIEGPKGLTNKYIKKRGGEKGIPNPHYAAMVESIDQNVGRIMKSLEEKGVLENTVVIFTSDNGGLSVEEVPAFAKHTPPTDNYPLAEGKGYLYEGGIRVPLIMHWPAAINTSRVIEEPVVGTDLYNTFCDIFDLPEKTVNGKSLFPYINGTGTERTIVWHAPHYSPQGGKPASAIRKGNYKLIQFYEDNNVELYNLNADPEETKDLSLEEPDKTKELLNELNAWKEQNNAKIPVPNPGYAGDKLYPN